MGKKPLQPRPAANGGLKEMTRAERHTLVLRLKAQGLSFSHISDQVGIRWETLAMICRKAQQQGLPKQDPTSSRQGTCEPPRR